LAKFPDVGQKAAKCFLSKETVHEEYPPLPYQICSWKTLQTSGQRLYRNFFKGTSIHEEHPLPHKSALGRPLRHQSNAVYRKVLFKRNY
jgi:hypothetical protein